jgi:hypothetical protein
MDIRRIILEELILENRVDDALNLLDKFLNKNNVKEPTQLKFFEGFDILVDGDPSGNHKYLQWMTKRLMEHQLTVSDTRPIGGLKHLIPRANGIVNVVKSYHDNIERASNKDINSFKSLGSLRDEVIRINQKIKEKEEEKRAKKEIDKIYEDDRWLVVVPKSHLASCKYGAGTQWCTTSKHTDEHFNEYTEDGILFYFIDKQSSSDEYFYKLAMYIEDVEHYINGNFSAYDEWEIYDAEDDEHKSSTILPFLPKKLISSINDYLTSKEKVEGYKSNRPLFDNEYDMWDYTEDLLYNKEGDVLNIILGVLYEKGYVDGDYYEIDLDTTMEPGITIYDVDEEGNVYYDNHRYVKYIDLGELLDYEGESDNLYHKLKNLKKSDENKVDSIIISEIEGFIEKRIKDIPMR